MNSCRPVLQRPCMRNRWGEGTNMGCAEHSKGNSPAEAKMSAIIQERQRQDTEIWGIVAAFEPKNPPSK